MNLLEHYIMKVHSVKDITNEFERRIGYTPDEPLLEVDLTYDCYGMLKRTKVSFFKSNWEAIQKQGYFFA